MIVGIGFRKDMPEAVELKNKISHYLQTQNVHILIADDPESKNNPLENMEQASQLLLQNKVDKVILVCRTGSSAQQASLNINIPEHTIAKHGTIAIEQISDYIVYTTGFAYDWKEIQSYLDQFIKEPKWR